MTNKILFAALGVLAIAIIGVGYTALRSNSSQTSNDYIPVATSTGDVSAEPTPTPAATSTGSTTQTPGTYTLAQVAEHASRTSCYTVVNGSVYDLTPFISSHPGGVPAISSLCGIDGTSRFMGQHQGQRRPEQELARLKIGVLAQ